MDRRLCIELESVIHKKDGYGFIYRRHFIEPENVT